MRGADEHREAVLARIVDGAPIAVIVVDAMGTVQVCSDACEPLFGYTPDELIGSNMLDHVDAEWNPLAIESIATALSASGLRLPMLFRIRTKDGGLRVVEVTAHTMFDDPIVEGMVVYVRSWDEQARLDDIVEALAGDAAVDTKLDLFVQVMASETLHADGAVLLAPSDGSFTQAVAAPGLPVVLGAMPAPGSGGASSPDADAVAPWEQVLRSGTEVVSRVHDLADPWREVAADRGYEWCWAFPVRDAAGEIEACLLLWRRADEPLEEYHQAWIRKLSRLTALVLEQDRTHARLRHAANHDPLTGLANRAAFAAEAATVLDDPRRGPLVGVLYLDLDGFKPVNDRLGHGAGDTVLVTLARRFRHRTRDEDLVARLGGDEFAVLCPGIHDASELELLAARLSAAAAEPVRIGEHEVRVGSSVGAAVARVGTVALDALVAAADAALYEAKAEHAGVWRLVELGEQPAARS